MGHGRSTLIPDSGPSDSAAPARGSDLEQDPAQRQAWFRTMWEGELEGDKAAQQQPQQEEEDEDEEEAANDADDDDDPGDDFDEFAEGGGDDDFGDFDEAQEVMTPQSTAPSAPAPQPTVPAASILAGLVSSVRYTIPVSSHQADHFTSLFWI